MHVTGRTPSGQLLVQQSRLRKENPEETHPECASSDLHTHILGKKEPYGNTRLPPALPYEQPQN